MWLNRPEMGGCGSSSLGGGGGGNANMSCFVHFNTSEVYCQKHLNS